MGFTDAIATCFRKYVTFSGRAPRAEFWWFVLFLLLVNAALIAVHTAIFGSSVVIQQVTKISHDGRALTYLNRVTHYDSGMMGSIFTIAMLVPLLAVTWRRMHDMGGPGWVLFLPVPAAFGLLAGVSYFNEKPIAVHRAGGDPSLHLPATANVPQTPAWVSAVLILLVLAAIILSIIWLAWPSEPETNEYGPNPYEVTP